MERNVFVKKWDGEVEIGLSRMYVVVVGESWSNQQSRNAPLGLCQLAVRKAEDLPK